jgi:hypothetical protein
MPRLSDLPDPYAIVVILPGTSSTPASTSTVNGRIARMIAWLLDHGSQISAIRGSVVFNFGDRGFQAELRETFPYQNVSPSVARDLPQSSLPATPK